MPTLLILVLAFVANAAAYDIYPSTATDYGKWRWDDNCPSGEYAAGFEIKNQGYQGAYDDSAVNGIRLQCKSRYGWDDGKRIQSKVGHLGDWRFYRQCSGGHFLTGVRFRSEGPQGGNGDDTGVTNVEFRCNDGTVFHGGGHDWGSWGRWAHCPGSQKICGILTKVEGPNSDNTGLNAAKLKCCRD